MITEKTDHKHSKYLEEEYPLVINFTTRVRAGQTLQANQNSVTVEDEKGNNVTSTFIDSVSSVHPSVSFLLKRNAGTRGKTYLIRAVVYTENDRIEQTVALEIK